MADHVRKTFKWHLKRALHPPRPLPEDYQDLCPNFTLPDAEEAAHDFNILEIVQASFHAMLLNDAVGLYLVSRDMVRGLNPTLQGLQWTTFELLLNDSKRALLEVQLRQRIPSEGDPGPPGGEEESSSLNEPPPPLVMSSYGLSLLPILHFVFCPCKVGLPPSTMIIKCCLASWVFGFLTKASKFIHNMLIL